MKRAIHSDVYMSGILLILALLMYLRTHVMPVGAATFPRLVLILFIGFTLWTLYQGVKKTGLLRKGECTDPPLSVGTTRLPLLTLLIVIIYTTAIKYLGFFFSTSLFIAGFMYFYQIRDWRKMSLTIIGVNLFIYFLFVVQLHVPLPEGLFY